MASEDRPASTQPPRPAGSRTVSTTTRFGLHLAQVAALAIGLRVSGLDVVFAVFASVAVSGVHWVAFLRCGARPTTAVLVAGLVLLWPMLGTSGPFALAWLLGGAAAGAAGAELTRRRAREDAFFFVPLGVGLGVFLVVVWVGAGLDPGRPLEAAAEWVAAQRQLTEQQVGNADGMSQREQAVRETWQRLRPWLGPLLLTVVALIWAPALWMTGRLARRSARRLDRRRASLLLFNIRQPYVFLLICAIVSWIVGILSGHEKAVLYGAAPLLALFFVACLIEGLAVFLFQLALWRATAPRWVFQAMLLVGLAIVVLLSGVALSVLALVGLLDIWFDFRRLRAIEQRFGGGR